MTSSLIGACVGLLLAGLEILVLRRLAARVDLAETKQALKTAGIVQLFLFPVIGWFAAPYLIGD